MESGANKNKLQQVWAAEKKKLITAFCLVLIMIFMWVRILAGGGPEETKGSVDEARKSADKNKMEIEFIELPEIEGRNDSISQNYFSLRKSSFVKKSSTGTEAVGKAGKDEKPEGLKNKLRLQAIEHGDVPMAFINDSLYREGDTLNLKLGERIYKLKVIEVNSEKVILDYSGTEFVLRLQ